MKESLTIACQFTLICASFRHPLHSLHSLVSFPVHMRSASCPSPLPVQTPFWCATFCPSGPLGVHQPPQRIVAHPAGAFRRFSHRTEVSGPEAQAQTRPQTKLRSRCEDTEDPTAVPKPNLNKGWCLLGKIETICGILKTNGQ